MICDKDYIRKEFFYSLFSLRIEDGNIIESGNIRGERVF